MKVNEVIQKLQKLADQGHGSLELVFVDTRSGVSNSVYVGNVSSKNSSDFAPPLCDWDDGTKYVPLYQD